MRRAPHEWPDVATLVDNNFRNMHKRDVASKGREAADKERVPSFGFHISVVQYRFFLVLPAFDQSNNLRSCQEYMARVAYCIPVLVNAAKCFDVSFQQTPEMQTEAAFVSFAWNPCRLLSSFVSTFSAALARDSFLPCAARASLPACQ